MFERKFIASWHPDHGSVRQLIQEHIVFAANHSNVVVGFGRSHIDAGLNGLYRVDYTRLILQLPFCSLIRNSKLPG